MKDLETIKAELRTKLQAYITLRSSFFGTLFLDKDLTSEKLSLAFAITTPRDSIERATTEELQQTLEQANTLTIIINQEHGNHKPGRFEKILDEALKDLKALITQASEQTQATLSQ